MPIQTALLLFVLVCKLLSLCCCKLLLLACGGRVDATAGPCVAVGTAGAKESETDEGAPVVFVDGVGPMVTSVIVVGATVPPAVGAAVTGRSVGCMEGCLVVGPKVG